MSPAIRLSWALCGLALSCFSQSLQIGGPIAGFVFDAPTGSLRQVLGMPGAARLSAPVLSDVTWASVAPNGQMALVARQGETRLVSRDNIGQDPAGAPVESILSEPQLSAWAADSSAVALYSSASNSIQWVRFSAQAATAETPIPLTGVDGTVTAITADPSSSLALVTVAGAGVYRVTTTDGTTQVLAAADISAIALEPGAATLWAADRANAQVLQIQNPGSTEPAVSTLLADPEKLADVSALGLSSDRKQLYLASRTTSLLYWFDRSAAQLSDGIALDAPVTELLPLGRPSLLLLGARDKAGAALYVLDERSGPGIFFVPAPAGEGDSAQ
ncbi:MAG: hypothetical protein QM757_28800 [Paludibaculum sp.]